MSASDAGLLTAERTNRQKAKDAKEEDQEEPSTCSMTSRTESSVHRLSTATTWSWVRAKPLASFGALAVVFSTSGG